MKTTECYMEVVVDFMLFLEFSDPAVLNEDVAVDMLEHIAVCLRKLSTDEKVRLLEYLHSRGNRTESLREREFLANLLEHLGIDNM
ncbi:hypothetical protein LBMAG48_01540 [Phycisphaerae bacterium]|nr:hypothetical protein LBMAG48_01540 [Phycisphaerae bacterium]